MSIEHLKTNFLFKQAQLILFNRTGNVVESCDTFIKLSALTKKSTPVSIYDNIPMLHALEDSLKNLHEYPNGLHFPRVEFPYGDQYRVFDFTFLLHPNNHQLIMLYIQDFSTQYAYLYKVQQERNVSIIKHDELKLKTNTELLRKDVEHCNKILQLRLEYFTQISQEIQSPIQEVNKMAELLSDYLQDDNGKIYLNSIQKITKNIDNSIIKLLNLQSLDKDLGMSQVGTFNLKKLINNVVNSISDHLIEPIHTRPSPTTTLIITNYDNNTPTVYSGYPLSISQIIFNLLSIAKKFSTPSSKICVIVKKNPHTSAHDNQPESMITISLKFSPQDMGMAHLNQENKLAIANKIVQMMGGTLFVNTNDLAGAHIVFTINLPIEVAKNMRLGNIADSGS